MSFFVLHNQNEGWFLELVGLKFALFGLLARHGAAALGVTSMSVAAVWRKPRAQLVLTVELATRVLESWAPAARPHHAASSSLPFLGS